MVTKYIGFNFERVFYFKLSACSLQQTLITHLATRLCVEGGGVEHHHAVLSCFEFCCRCAIDIQSQHFGGGLQFVVTDKGVARACVLQRTVHFEFTGRTGLGFLAFHGGCKASFVDAQIALAANVGRQVQGEAIGVVQFESHVTRQYFDATFKRRIEEGRGRLTLIANEVARLAGTILLEFGAATRKIKDTKNAPDATADCAQQLQRLMPKNFMAATPWPQLQHYARYLKAITLRLDKYRADPARDAQRLTELKPQEQRYWRLVAERKGAQDTRMLEFRWLLEELRVSFFAQELRTPQPVSIKRLEKAWGQLSH